MIISPILFTTSHVLYHVLYIRIRFPKHSYCHYHDFFPPESRIPSNWNIRHHSQPVPSLEPSQHLSGEYNLLMSESFLVRSAKENWGGGWWWSWLFQGPRQNSTKKETWTAWTTTINDDGEMLYKVSASCVWGGFGGGPE